MSTDTPPDTEPDFSLVGPSAMGGIVGAGGFDFQTRYILCRLVDWTAAPGFRELLHEGTGDVDVRFDVEGQEYREHIQVKDHGVTPSEFREVVETFVGFDRAMPGVYQRFVLAAPALSTTLNPLHNYLKRLRGAGGFFDTKPAVLESIRQKIRQKLKAWNLEAHADFILERVEFDVNLHDCHDDSRSRTVFIGNMVGCSADIWRKFIEASSRVYDRLFSEINSRRQQGLSRTEIEAILSKLSAEIVISLPEQALAVIGVHNWAYEKLDPPPHHELDWSERFDRSVKRVPDAEHWDTELIPEIYRIQKALLREKGSGLVRIAGSGCLSTQFALGLAFRELEGWIIETTQYPANEAWRSNAVPTPDYALQIEETLQSASTDAIALLLSVKNNVQPDVKAYLDSKGIAVRAIVNVLPSTGAGSISIKSNGDAVALAIAARDALRSAQEKHGVKMTHLFMSGPQSLALFLGQRLTSMGRIQLYEYQDPGYAPSCLLRT